MAKDKIKKLDFARRKHRSVQKKQIKRKIKQIKLRAGQQRIDFVERPALSDMGPPEGFRTIPMSQAIMQYARPLMEKTNQKKTCKVHCRLRWSSGITALPGWKEKSPLTLGTSKQEF